MKKLFLGMLITTLFAISSCSLESEEKISDKNQIGFQRLSTSNLERAKELFKTMMLSNDYKDLEIIRKNFVTKMNKNVVYLNSKEDYMRWISENLYKTNFISVGEFEMTLDAMVAKQTILLNNNSELYGYIQNAESDEILDIIKPSLGTTPPIYTSNSCSDACMDDCSTQLDALEVATAFLYALQGPNQNPLAMAIIDAMYWTRFEIIVDDLNDCISGC